MALDWVEVAALVTGGAAALKVFWPTTQKNRTISASAAHTVTELLDDSVLARFEELFLRIGLLETDLADAKRDLAVALVEIRELRKLEEYLQARLHEKNSEILKMQKERDKNREEITRLRSDLSVAQDRISHLEAVCQRAGINGEIIEDRREQ